MKATRPVEVLSIAILASILIATGPGAARAFSGGITTNSFDEFGQACNECHGGGSTPTVALIGPTFVMPGSTNMYLLEIDAIGAQNRGGLNVSALLGDLDTGGIDAANTQSVVGTGGRDEITHTGAKPAVLGTVSFSFLWTAPMANTTVDLLAWGNAVNFDFSTNGDRANDAILNVTVGTGGGLPNLDHYKCYQGKDLKNPKFVKTTAATSDQLVPNETVDVQKVKYVCTPVDKNGEGIMDPSAHLICYQIKGAKLDPGPKTQVSTQFQISQFEVKKGKLLCVPGTKTIIP